MLPLKSNRNSAQRQTDGLQQILADQAARHQGQEEVNQVQVAHGLQWREPDQGRKSKHDHGNDLLKDSVREDSHRKAGQYCLAAFLRHAPQQPEQQQGSQRAQPLVPLPFVEVVVGPRVQRLLQAGLAGSKTQPSGTNAAATESALAGLNDWSHTWTGSDKAMVRKKQNEMPIAAMMGWMTKATSNSGTARQRLPSIIHAIASRISAVATLRGCKCGSTRKRRPRHRQGKHGRHHGDARPLRARLGKQASRNAPAGEER